MHNKHFTLYTDYIRETRCITNKTNLKQLLGGIYGNFEKNTKHCSVGEYDFDVAINRQIVLDGFKQFPNLWKVVARNSKYSGNVDALEDISAFTDLVEANDIIEEVTPKYVAYVLPKCLNSLAKRLTLTRSISTL